MSNKKNIDDYFDDNFEVTYTDDLPQIHIEHEDYDERYDDRYDDTDYLDDYDDDYDDTDYLDSDYDDDYEEEDSYDRRRPARRSDQRNFRRRSGSSSEELAAPIRNITRTGSTIVEKLTNFILRPAPVLMSAIILAITFFSFWNQMADYGDIKTLSSNPDLTLVAYLAVGGVMLIWMLSTFFFTLSGIWHGNGRGLTYFILVYVLSYLFSLAAAAIPADIELLTGIRGGILVFGSLYPAYFPFCVVGIITCILRKVLK